METFLLLTLAIGLVLVPGLGALSRERYALDRLNTDQPAYSAGSNYVYRYETQVVSGLPQTSPVYTIVKMIATANIQFQTASKAILKLEDVQLYKMNGRMDVIDPTTRQVPVELLQPIQDEDTARLQQILSIPVKFRYTNGFVSGLVAEAEEPACSLNLKKGCLSMLQVNMDKSKVIEAGEAVFAATSMGDLVSEAYTVMETSPAGECASTYSVQEVSPEEMAAPTTGSVFEVKKVRDFKNCVERPIFLHEAFGAVKCAECQTFNNEPLEVVSGVRYVLTGSREKFVVRSAIAEGRYMVTTENQGNGYAASIVNQTLTLVSAEPQRGSIRGPRVPAECPEGLIAVVPEALIQQRQQLTEATLALAPPEIQQAPMEAEREPGLTGVFVKEALSAIRALAIDVKGGVSEEAPQISMVAAEMIRSGTLEELTEVWRTVMGDSVAEDITEIFPGRNPVPEMSAPYSTRQFESESVEVESESVEVETEPVEIETEPVEKEMRKITLQLFPTAGTIAAVRVIAQAVKAGQIPERSLAHAIFPYMAINAYPVPANLETILELTKHDVLPNKHARRAAWLCVGTLVYRMDKVYREKHQEMCENLEKTQIILSQEGRGKPKQQLQMLADRNSMMKEAIAATREQVRKTFIDEITALLQTGEEKEKIVALKAIGNSGLSELLPIVAEILQTESLPMVVRQQAVYAARRMGAETPREVLEVMLPVYMDAGEHELVRIAAFTTMLKCQPPLPYLQMVAQSLEEEVNPQVASYVYSYLSEISNSTYPCFTSLANNASTALKFAKRPPTTIHSSYFRHISGKNEKRTIAQVVEASVIGSRDSILPRGASISSLLHFMGYSHESEIAIQAEGAQAIVDRMFGPAGILTGRKSIFQFLRPKRSIGSNMEYVEKIAEVLKIAAREIGDVAIDVIFKYQGNEINFFTLDAELISSLTSNIESIFGGISEQSLSQGVSVHSVVSLSNGGLKAILPTESGLPLTVQSSIPVVFSLQGGNSASLEPPFSEAIMQGSFPKAVKSAFNIRPRGPKAPTTPSKWDNAVDIGLAMDAIGAISVDTAFYRSAVLIGNRAFIHNMGLTGILEADLVKGKLFTSLETPQEEKKIGGFKVKPVTYLVKNNAHTLNEAMEIVAPEGGSVFPTYAEFLPQYNFGTKLGFRTMFASAGGRVGGVSLPMSGMQSAVLYIAPDENPAAKFAVNLQLVSSDEFSQEIQEEEEAGSPFSSLWDNFGFGSDSSDEQSWDQHFDLRQNDLSIAAVAAETGAPILENAIRNALAISIEGVGTSPVKRMTLQALCQRTINAKRIVANAKICTTVQGYQKTTQISSAFNFNRNEITVEEMASPEYQQLIRENIKTIAPGNPVSEEAVSRANAMAVSSWQRLVTSLKGSEIPPYTEAVSRANAMAVSSWQRLVTSLKGSEIPPYTESEDMISVSLPPQEQAILENVQEILLKQERIARRVADPVLQTMVGWREEQVAQRLEAILQETKAVERAAERALRQIRQRITGRLVARRLQVISLKVIHAIHFHRSLLERVEVLLRGSPIRRARRVVIQEEIRAQIAGCERLVQVQGTIVKKINIPEDDTISYGFYELDSGLRTTIGRIETSRDRQITIATEIERIQEALANGASPASVITPTKQILEHCNEIVVSCTAVAEELNAVNTQVSQANSQYAPRNPSFVASLKLYQVIIQQDLLFQRVRSIQERIKYSPEAPVDEVLDITCSINKHLNGLQALLGKATEALAKIETQTAERNARVGGRPELTAYMTGYVNVTYQAENRQPTAVQVKIFCDKSLEQLIYESRQANKETRDPIISKILRSEADESEIATVRKEINTLRNIKINVAYSQSMVKPKVRYGLEWLLSYLKAKNIQKMSLSAVNVTTEPGEAKVDIDFSRAGEVVSYAVSTPMGTTKFWAVPVPMVCPAGVSMIGREEGLVGRFRGQINAARASCVAREERLETFDGRLYQIPKIDECEKVLAMDCSPDRRFAITLLGKRQEKIIKVVVEKQVVEVIPRPNSVRVRVNGVVSRLSAEPILIRAEGVAERAVADRAPIVLRIERRRTEVVVKAEQVGFAIRLVPTSGRIRIEASQFLRSKVCGLCGNYDGQIRGEYEDPERLIHARPESFAVRYTIPSDTCVRQSLEQTYPARILSRPGGCGSVRRHTIKERVFEGTEEVCISTLPTRRCPTACGGRGEIRRSVGFHCMPSRDPSVQSLVEKAKTSILRKLAARKSDIFEDIMEPAECINA